MSIWFRVVITGDFYFIVVTPRQGMPIERIVGVLGERDAFAMCPSKSGEHTDYHFPFKQARGLRHVCASEYDHGTRH